MKLIVPKSGVFHTDEVDDGNYAWIRHLPTPSLDWILITAKVANGWVSDIKTANYGPGKNSYEIIRKVLREAVETDPDSIILELMGDVHLKYMETPLTNHFGADVFEIDPVEDLVPFPIIGY